MVQHFLFSKEQIRIDFLRLQGDPNSGLHGLSLTDSTFLGVGGMGLHTVLPPKL